MQFELYLLATYKSSGKTPHFAQAGSATAAPIANSNSPSQRDRTSSQTGAPCMKDTKGFLCHVSSNRLASLVMAMRYCTARCNGRSVAKPHLTAARHTKQAWLRIELHMDCTACGHAYMLTYVILGSHLCYDISRRQHAAHVRKVQWSPAVAG